LRIVLGVVIGTIALACATAVVPSTAATGAPSSGRCEGIRVRSTEVKNGVTGARIGYFRIYYDDGYNCARLDISSAGRGLYYKIGIVRCRQTAPGRHCSAVPGTSDHDSGTFSSYAGPVITYAPRTCIAAYFTVRIGAGGPYRAIGGTPYTGGVVFGDVGAAHCR
jgi:hypothetical protein